MTFVMCAFVAICTVLIALYLKPQQREIGVLLVIAGTVFLFFVGLKNTSEAVRVIREIVGDSSYSAEVEIMMKALGIAAVTHISADICRESGEGTVASQVEFVGRMEILILSLPLVLELLSLAKAFLL